MMLRKLNSPQLRPFDHDVLKTKAGDDWFTMSSRTKVPPFHRRGLLAIVPDNDVSPLALRPSDVPKEWRARGE